MNVLSHLQVTFKNMNPKRSTPSNASSKGSIALAALIATLGAESRGALIYKADNVDDLASGTSWLGGVVPGAADVAVFDGTVNSGLAPEFYMAINAPVEFGGIQINANKPGLIFDTFFSGGAAILVTLGRDGVDMSAGTPGTTVTFDNPTIVLRAGTVPSLKVVDGGTLLFKGPLNRQNAAGMRFNLGATNLGTIQVDDGTWGTSNAILGNSTVAFSGVDDNPSDGRNYSVDFAALNSSRHVKSARSLVGTVNYSDNPNTGAALPNLGTSSDNTVLDVVNSNTAAGATAYRITSNQTLAGIRFDQPHATGLDWIVDTSTTTRNINFNGRGLLVGPNVGAKNVIYNGSSQFRFGANNFFYIHQLNPSGDLILNIAMNQSAGGGTQLVKTGPGRVILASNGNSLGGATTIVEGTVQVGNNGTTGSINNGQINNFGTLAFHRNNAWTLNNVITGSGVVSHIGSGTLTLGGLNTFTGPLQLNAGSVAFSVIGNLGSSNSPVVFGGGALQWADGNTTDISTKSVIFGTGGGTLNVGINDVSLASSIGGGGLGGMTKAGTGTLTVQSANSYQGTTSIAAGTLVVANPSGSATGSGPVSIGGSGTLAGTGIISGTVSTTAGSLIKPGISGVGTLTTGGLALNAGSITELEVASAGSFDKVVTTNANALTLSGGGIRLFDAGTRDPLSLPGTYNIFQFSGDTQGTGPASLSVLNPKSGYAYSFSNVGNQVALLVELDSILTSWTSNTSGTWSNAANWSNSVPAAGYTALFTTELLGQSFIELDGTKTVNGMVFDSAESYSLIPALGGGSLNLDKGAKTVAINVLDGDHFISTPVNFVSNVGVTAGAGSSLSFTNAISGVGSLVKDGEGRLNLEGVNTFSGNVTAVLGTLGFSGVSSLGTGSLTLNGATLEYNPGNTADISAKTITFGLNGATINTGANNVVFANSVGNSGPGAFTKSGTGRLQLLSNLTHAGTTTVAQGVLEIPSNEAIGPSALNNALILSGGSISPSSNLSLTDGGTQLRPITVQGTTGGVSVASSLTLTVPGVISGTGTLNKNGPGTLTVLGNNSATFSGPVSINEGSVRLGNDRAIGQTGLGTGPITFQNGSVLFMNGFGSVDNGNTFGTLSNALVFPAGTSSTINMARRAVLGGVATGSGLLNLYVDGVRSEVSGVWPNFGGQIVVRPVGTTGEYRPAAGQNLVGASVHLTNGVTWEQGFNPPTGTGTETLHQYGELKVDAGAILGGNPVGGRFNHFSVGALNSDFEINGRMRGQLNTFGYGYSRLTKVGTGTLTLRNDHMTTGAVTVNGGTLRLLGNIERFYLGIGADGAYGRFPETTGTTDDTISLTPPVGDFQNVEPGTFTVAVGATLAGNGRLGGAVTINGNLIPDSLGQLHITNAGTLALSSSALSQFNFTNALFTGVRVDADGGLSYGGTLRINIPGTIFGGTFTLFQANGTRNGDFSSVLVNTGLTPDALLTNTAGVWSGVVDGVTFSFSEDTGVLTVDGGATATVPSAPAGLSAIASSGSVSLSWSAVGSASSYRVRRGLVSGGPYTLIASGILGTSYQDTGLTNGTTYYYVVEALGAQAISGYSSEASATPVLVLPDAPTALGAVGGDAVVNLNWTAGANTTSFTVLRSTASDGVYAAIASNILGTTYADTTAVNGTTYYYVVRGINPQGAGPDSNIASATPQSVLTALQQWRQLHFGSPDNTGAGADENDADGDGVKNLVEYATGTLPLVATSVAAPTVGISSNVVNLTFNRIADPTLIYTVRSAAELNTGWSPVPVFTSTGASNVAGSVTANDTTVVPAGGRRFLRLEVTY